MNMLSKVGLLCLVVSAVVLGGCTKDVRLTFTNTTDTSRIVTLTLPGEGPDTIGSLPPASQLVQKIKIKNEDLPASVGFAGGDQNGVFTVNEDSKDEMFIDFTPNGPQVRSNKKTLVIQKTEKTVGPVVIEKHEVVE